MVSRSQARDGAFAGTAGGMLGPGGGAVGVVAHGHIGHHAFHAVLVFADQIGREPDAWLLLDGVHGNRVRRFNDLRLLQCDVMSRFA